MTKQFGEVVKKRRKALDLTQQRLAERVNCSVDAIRKIESGQRRPSLHVASLMADALKISSGERDQFLKAARQPHSLAQADIPFVEPTSTNLFLGRNDELARLDTYFATSYIRLITVTGPGGIGKSRLARQVIATRQGRFQDGAVFVSITAALLRENLVSAIASAIGLHFHDQLDPEKQLRQALRERKILLVLDNFEPSLDRLDLLKTLLYDCPSVQFLVTTRIRLNLLDEWVLPIYGLSFPVNEFDDPLSFSAVQLFVERARQASPYVTFTLPELQTIAEICRYVKGSPLAIELAAAWTFLLSCAEILARLQQSLDSLSRTAHDALERHYSLRAVFEQSWAALDQEEQKILTQLTIFNGGFRVDAAQAIVGANLKILGELVSKSLLHVIAPNRLDLHDLIREYVLEKATHLLNEGVNPLRYRHADYYMATLRSIKPMVIGPAHVQGLARINEDLENIRLAWHWFIDQNQIGLLNEEADVLCIFYEYECRYREGKLLFAPAFSTSASTHDSLAWTWIETYFAWFCFREGEIEMALSVLQSRGSLALLEADSSLPNTRIFFPLYAGGVIYSILGYPNEGLQYLHEAAIRANSVGDQQAESMIYYGTGLAYQEQKQFAQAEQYFHKSLLITRELGHELGIALCLYSLGQIAIVRNEPMIADTYFQESQALFTKVFHAWGVVISTCGRGQVALKQNNLESASQYLREALVASQKLGTVETTLQILLYLGDLSRKIGNMEWACKTFKLVAHNIIAWPLIREAAQNELEDCAMEIISDASETIEGLVQYYLSELRS